MCKILSRYFFQEHLANTLIDLVDHPQKSNTVVNGQMKMLSVYENANENASIVNI